MPKFGGLKKLLRLFFTDVDENIEKATTKGGMIFLLISIVVKLILSPALNFESKFACRLYCLE